MWTTESPPSLTHSSQRPELFLKPMLVMLDFTDTRADEQERGITIKSTGVTLYYEL